MEWIVASGSLCLGLLIGILIAWYMLDVKEVNLTALYSSVAIAVGGSVLGFFKFLSPGGTADALWFYPIGLFLGFVGASVYDTIMYGYDRSRERRK
jgi:hypothetical protein